MSASFYHISIQPGPPTIEDILSGDKDNAQKIEKKLELSYTWYKYADGAYVVYTKKNAATWYNLLRPFIRKGGKIFICRLDVSDRQGWMNKEFWNWLRTASEISTA
jgi:hypothetical protein